ncbi:Calx-beta domain-containing protein [Motilibacter deserti]|uniref:EF-hand domain-containing protein n=1 Tax=Motilibacter deserti TaxID=2714956 RepID=A0ABX0GRZ5_9ACTN|nr:Calx-beta domain-containing protein [Motilibacter deserti]NHC13648.1 hypothetical protein [Motilibacter deserti]
MTGRLPGVHRAPRTPAPRTWAYLLVAVLATLGLAGAVRAGAAPGSSDMSFSWAMADRIGQDADGDGRVDYDTSPGYLNPTSWKATFDACAAPAVKDRGAGTQVVWTVKGGPLDRTVATGCKTEQQFPSLGSYAVTATIAGDPGATTAQTVTLKDVFLVSVGDSVASGEGNPDTVGPAPIGPFPFYGPVWQDRQCHRSALAGPAQAAIRLEKRDPHSSVTFLHLACSGATIETGVLGPYEGIEPKLGPVKPAQLDEAVRLASGRKIDGLMMSIGANNLGFAPIVKSCLALAHCHTATVPVPDNAQHIYDTGLPKLAPAYAQLDARIDQLAAAGKVDKVFLSQYFDVAQYDDGSICSGLTDAERAANKKPDGSVSDGFSQDEHQWATSTVVPGLNNAVKAAADKADDNGGPAWTLVDGIAAKFAKHGYCAKDRWIRQLFESFAYQHDQNGAFHPNAEGHLYGYGARIEEVAAPVLGIAGTPAPFGADPAVDATAEGVSGIIATLDELNAFEQIANLIPVADRENLNAFYQDLFTWMAWAQQKIEQFSAQAGSTITALDAFLDDLNGDGNSADDIPGLPGGVKVDVDVDIQPHVPSTEYDVKLKLDVARDGKSDFEYESDGLELDGVKALTSAIRWVSDLDARVRPAKKDKDKDWLTIPAEKDFGTVKLKHDGTLDSTSTPLKLNVGLLSASATGKVKADIAVGAKFKDPDKNGVIDASELGLGLFSVSCTSGGADIALDVKAGLKGLEGKVGKVTLTDKNLCDGFKAPDFQLAELGDFENVTVADFVNGLAQLTTALSAAQQSGDLDLPFVKEGLSAVVSLNERLVKFFVDNGLTDPADPMATITIDPTKQPDFATLDKIVPKLVAALGLPSSDALNVRWEGGRLLLDVKLASDPAAKPDAGTLDFGDTLKSAGLLSLTGSAKATVDPAYALDLTLGADLRPGLALDQRFFVKAGTGPELTLDGAVTADVDLTGKASLLAVTVRDTANGAVPLLQRKDPAKPMVAIDLVDRSGDGVVTLAELGAAVATSQSPVSIAFNATLPATVLDVVGSLAGTPLATGKVTVSWPQVPDTSGSGAFKLTADAAFTNTLLPFAYDPDDPTAIVGQVLTAARETVVRLRTALADDPSAAANLPLVGRSVADLDPLLAKLVTALDDIIAVNDALTLEQAEQLLEKALAQGLGVTGTAPDLVKLGYEPATADKQAALLVSLKLGACTTDRSAGRDGCTVTPAPFDVPLNLRLGKTASSPGLAGLGAAGSVRISYDARAMLDFGIELPRVTLGSTASTPPGAGGAKPRLFVVDTSRLDLGLGAKVSGTFDATLGAVTVKLGKAGKPAQAAVAARFVLAKQSPTRQRLTNLKTFFESLLPAPGTGNVHEPDAALQATCTGAPAGVDACAVLPVTLQSTELGDVTFHAPDLLEPDGWAYDIEAVKNSLSSPAVQFSLLIDGLRLVAQKLQAALEAMPAGSKIPLLGADPTAGAEVLERFDQEVLGRAQTLVTQVQEATSIPAIEQRTRDLLGSIPILLDTNKDGVRDGRDVTVTLLCRKGSGVGSCDAAQPVGDLQSFEVKLPVGGTIVDAKSAFDIGFPGLRLASEAEVTGKVSWQLDLAFGVDRTNGFYVPTNTQQAELQVTASAALPNSTSGNDMEATLAFLPIAVEDLNVGDDITLELGVDLKSSAPGGILTLQQLGSLDLQPSIDAQAKIELGLATYLRAGQTSSLPKVKADLRVGGKLSWTGAAGSKPEPQFTVKFDNVRFDIGSIVTDFLRPVARDLRTFISPIEPTLDAIEKPIPGVSEAARWAGKPAPRWIDLMRAVDSANTQGGRSSGLQLIDRMLLLKNLAQALDQPAGQNGELLLGSFELDTSAAAGPVPADQLDSLLKNPTYATGTGGTKKVLERLPGLTAKKELSDAQTKGGFTFPAFDDPKLLFGMLIGKDVPLVYYDAGKLGIERSFQFSYPIGPFTLYIGGSAGIDGHFAAGYDTYGFRKAFQVLFDDDPANNGVWDVSKGLLQGLYIDDRDQQGNDVPEVRFRAELTAGASVGVPGLSVGAEGGVEGNVDINLRDEDGKVRFEDIGRQFKVNRNPVCMFNASAHIGAFIRAVVDSPLGDVEYPIASATILDEPDLTEWCNTPQDAGEPKTAKRYADGTLVLNATAAPDTFLINQVAPHVVSISALGVQERFEGVNRVFGTMGGGADRVEVHGKEHGRLDVVLCGGLQADQLHADTGETGLYGDSGPGITIVEDGQQKPVPCDPGGSGGRDDLRSGAYADVLEGGPGDDAFDAGDGKDVLKGGAGNDSLRGGLGDDDVQGGGDQDTTDYSDHTDAVTVTLPGPSGSAGEKDSADGVETVIGSAGNDTIVAPNDRTVRIDGGPGDDTLRGGDSTDLLMGSSGNDTMSGGGGGNQIAGGLGDDRWVDGPGWDSFFGQEGVDTADYSAASGPVVVRLDQLPNDGVVGGQPDNVFDADTVLGGAYDDVLRGSKADETLRGNGGKDLVEGGPGRDALFGGDGPDTVHGDAGQDTLDGEAGDDTVDGGSGSDDLRGGAGYDTVDYADRTESLKVSKDDVIGDGSYPYDWSAGGQAQLDNVRTDLEHIVTGSARDDVWGWNGPDVIEAREGGDNVFGMGGTDRLDGGPGNDNVYDVDYGGGILTDGVSDEILGGDGNDYLVAQGGDDRTDGGAGDDEVWGSPQKDTILGGPGRDTVNGRDGDDRIEVQDGGSWVDAGRGDDTVIGSAQDDWVYGGLGADRVETFEGNDTVYGYSEQNPAADGANIISTGPGVDAVIGGDAVDTIDTGDGEDQVNSGGGGNDVVVTGPGKDSANGGAGNDTIDTGEGDDAVRGDEGDDTLRGGDGRDTMTGGDGNDTLGGGAGNDAMDGGQGDDTLDGGTGADIFGGDAGFDTVTYAGRTTSVVVNYDGNANDGDESDRHATDPTSSQRDWLTDSVERVVGGTGDDTLTVDYAKQTPTTLEGGPGKDTLQVKAATARGTVTLLGGDGDDALTGGAGADVLDGGPGTDVEKSGSGDDWFVQGASPNGADDLAGGDGADTVDYSGRLVGSVAVTLDEVANDGAAGEGDNVRSDVESSVLGGVAPPPPPPVDPEPTPTVPAPQPTQPQPQPTQSAPAPTQPPAPAQPAPQPSQTTAPQPAPTQTAVPQPAPLKVSVKAASVAEGKPGQKAKLTFVVSLSAPAKGTVTVKWAASGVTAKAGKDFAKASGTVTFRKGQKSATVTVLVLGDRVKEKNETLKVTLTKASGAALGVRTATGTIRNDDR